MCQAQHDLVYLCAVRHMLLSEIRRHVENFQKNLLCQLTATVISLLSEQQDIQSSPIAVVVSTLLYTVLCIYIIYTVCVYIIYTRCDTYKH